MPGRREAGAGASPRRTGLRLYTRCCRPISCLLRNAECPRRPLDRGPLRPYVSSRHCRRDSISSLLMAALRLRPFSLPACSGRNEDAFAQAERGPAPLPGLEAGIHPKRRLVGTRHCRRHSWRKIIWTAFSGFRPVRCDVHPGPVRIDIYGGKSIGGQRSAGFEPGFESCSLPFASRAADLWKRQSPPGTPGSLPGWTLRGTKGKAGHGHAGGGL